MRDILNAVVSFFDEYVIQTVKEFSLVDLFDILILALVFYYLYCFIRDRRAGKLALGLGLILGMFLLSSVLDMYALKFVFANFYQLGFIAILIVFQPELRGALEKVGGTTTLGLRVISGESREMKAISAKVDALASAATDLARDKVGALIVIERSTKLGEYIKSGVEVDSIISPFILRNIFFDKAPLHDGAVIIKGDRICAAGCFLPLSTDNEIDKNLGTRHRAAIGMSEVSDAAVIVVSEETGNISLAVEGKLTRNYNYNTLKQELMSILSHQVGTEHIKKSRHKEKED